MAAPFAFGDLIVKRAAPAGVNQGQLQAEVIAVERPRLKGIGQRRAIGTAQAAVRRRCRSRWRLCSVRLRDALGVEEADHDGEQGPLGVDALRMGPGSGLMPIERMLAAVSGSSPH